MKRIEYESGINENGLPRKIEINRREDGSVYVRIKQPRQDCYLEEEEILAMGETIKDAKEIVFYA